MSLRSAAAAAVVACAALVACGDGSATRASIDQEEVQSLLVQRQRERNPRLKVSTATCPDDVPALQGESFPCTVDVEGVEVPFTVTVAEILGQRARYEFQPEKAIVDVAAVVDYVRSRLEGDWRSARIECGPGKVRLLDVGATLDCTAANGARTRLIQAVVEDREGTYSLREA